MLTTLDVGKSGFQARRRWLFALTMALIAIVGISAMDDFSVGADASGPDYYRVAGVEPGEFLEVRNGPSTTFPSIMQIPGDADGLTNFGCIDGDTDHRWCLIGHGRVIGWVPEYFLMESAGPETSTSGVENLSGSKWRSTRLGDDADVGTTNLAFKSEGKVVGFSGCNRFVGSFTEEQGVFAIDRVATTRKACPEPLMALESKFLAVLRAAQRRVSTDLVLGLLNREDIIIGQFERVD